MEKHNKSKDFSNIKPNEFNLNKGDKQFEVREYWCSNFMTSPNVLLQGEWLNPEKNERNALMTAICMTTGTLMGKNQNLPLFNP